MSSVGVREPDPGEWDMPVVELVEEGRIVGIVYLDDIELFVEFYPDEEGESWSFHVGDLQRALDTAQAMLLPEGTDALDDVEAAGTEHPVDALATEFDDAAAYRGEEDEGFYPKPVVVRIVKRAGELDLAVVALEAATVHDDWVDVVPGQASDIGSLHEGDPWPTFKAECNLYASTVLEKWPDREGLAISVEVADREGDRFVL